MRAQKLILIPFFMLWVHIAVGQYFDRLNYWRKHRHELILGLGTSNYMGDLGGGSGGRRPWLLDLEMSQFKFSWGLGYRYNLKYRWAVRANFNWVKVSGSDQLTENPERRYRNLSFESNIYELFVVAEYFILRAKPGHIHNIKGAKGQRGLPLEVIAHLGVGGFYFISKADGVPLAKLGTEGQGLEGGPKPYLPFSVCFPFGVGANYVITTNLKIGLDLSYRFTLTDYIDDASTTYYDNDVLRAQKGDLAADMADRSDGSNPSWTAAGAPRGNPKNNDHYLTAFVTVTYNINSLFKNGGRPGGKHSFLKKGKRAKF